MEGEARLISLGKSRSETLSIELSDSLTKAGDKYLSTGSKFGFRLKCLTSIVVVSRFVPSGEDGCDASIQVGGILVVEDDDSRFL